MKLKNLILASGLAALTCGCGCLCNNNKTATVEVDFAQYGAKQVKTSFSCQRRDFYNLKKETIKEGIETMDQSGYPISYYDPISKQIDISSRLFQNGVILAHPELVKPIVEITEECVNKLQLEELKECGAEKETK